MELCSHPSKGDLFRLEGSGDSRRAVVTSARGNEHHLEKVSVPGYREWLRWMPGDVAAHTCFMCGQHSDGFERLARAISKVSPCESLQAL